MDRAANTRREIAPLRVPWLQHEQFPATKQACSSDDGLVSSSKHTLVKVVRELKRGRANVDRQWAQLDSQLLFISDFLDGKSSNMFPPQLVVYVEDSADAVAPAAAAADGRRHCAGGAAVAGKFSGIFKSESAPPTPAMVEDDLNSDTPCTTIGLWKYLYAYSFFKTITPEDMEQALLLEDPNGYSQGIEPSGEGPDKVLAGLEFERLQDNCSLSESAQQNHDDVFKERLVASLIAVDTRSTLEEDKGMTSSRHPPDSTQPDDEDKHTTETPEVTEAISPLHSINLESWSPKGLRHVLREVGLIEGRSKEITQLIQTSPRDDEVSQEIRILQRRLRVCVEQTNESKRKMRKIMDGTKPWLSQKQEDDEATIKKYFTMWQTKKELARKKKLREKKLQRRQALRFGGGGGSGKPLADDIDVKQR